MAPKITIDMEKPSQWVSKLCRLYFADEYAKRTVGLPSCRHVPDIACHIASFDRFESYTRVIDGQVRCITPEVKPQNLQVIWNVQFITVFVPAWMIPPVYHSLRRESIKTVSSASPIGVQSVRPTWLHYIPATSRPQKEQPQPLHGLKLVIKEEVQPRFQSLELLAGRGLST